MVSLMNGLSSLGAGVSAFAGQAGLEVQKSQLANQQAVLADQLATTRETTLEGQRQTGASALQATQISAAAALEAQRQSGEGALQASQIAATSGLETQREAAAAKLAAEEQAAALVRTKTEIDKPTDTEKLFRFLRINPDGSPATGGFPAAAGGSGASTSPLAGPRATGGVAADGSVVPPLPGSSPAAAGTSGPASRSPSPPASPMDNPLVRRALGMPEPGSEDALRRSTASDVFSDPAWVGKTAGQRAAEVERRIAVSKGTLPSSDAQEASAQAMANYQMPPIPSGSREPGANETMSRVFAINPGYQASRYPVVADTLKRFGAEKEGDTVRALNVGVQHLATIDQAGAALANGDVKALNTLKNAFQSQFGTSPPTTFEGLKQVVASEILKATGGGIGTGEDRAHLMDVLNRASSPQQLQDMTNGFRTLMAGQLSGLKVQYEDGTHFTKGEFAFDNKLAPETLAALRVREGKAAVTPAATIPAWVKPGDQYSAARGQARGADGKIYGAPQ